MDMADFYSDQQPSTSGITLPKPVQYESTSESEEDDAPTFYRMEAALFKEQLRVGVTCVIFAFGEKHLVGLVVEHFDEEGTVNIKCMEKQHYGNLYYTWPLTDKFLEVPYHCIRTIIPTPKLTNKRLKRYYVQEMKNYK